MNSWKKFHKKIRFFMAGLTDNVIKLITNWYAWLVTIWFALKKQVLWEIEDFLIFKAIIVLRGKNIKNEEKIKWKLGNVYLEVLDIKIQLCSSSSYGCACLVWL